jgi:hypothetical protein
MIGGRKRSPWAPSRQATGKLADTFEAVHRFYHPDKRHLDDEFTALVQVFAIARIALSNPETGPEAQKILIGKEKP